MASTSAPRAMQHVRITSEHRLLDLRLDELWRYRDLVWLFTRRNFVVTYTQTVLGPLWLLINPLLTSVVYVVVFGNIAHLSTDGVPQLLFYLLGTAVWSYFSACVSRNARTFLDNANLFGKVYFPRLVVPISQVLGALIRLGIQLLLVAVLVAYYVARGVLAPRWLLLSTVPLVLVQLGILGMGFGIIISSLTTRYRDLSVLVDFGMSLWMYATPVVYPLSSLSPSLRALVLANPVTAPMEYLRYAIVGVGGTTPGQMGYSLAATAVVALVGAIVFSKVERTFIDTV